MNSLRISAFMVVACIAVVLVACSGSDGNPETSSGQGGGQAVSTDKGCGDKPQACISYDYSPDGKLAKVTVDEACDGPSGGQGDEATDSCWILTYAADKLATIVYDANCDNDKPMTYEFGTDGCPLPYSVTVGSNQADVSYECDSAGNVVNMKGWLNSEPSSCLAFSYDDHGNGSRLETSLKCSGTVDHWVSWAYTYDTNGKVLTQERTPSVSKDPPPAPEVAGAPECGAYAYATDGSLLALHWYDDCQSKKDYCYSYTKPPRGTCRLLPAFHDLVLCQ